MTLFIRGNVCDVQHPDLLRSAGRIVDDGGLKVSGAGGYIFVA